jgi:iron complex outermembrane receptor protein
MTAKRGLGLLSGVMLSLAVARQAAAQQVDYGALEQLFGQPVTTSATGSPQTASQVPADMEIITADDIRRSGATSIPDILRFVAGIDVRSYGATDSDVAIGGFSQPGNPRLLVLINGRQVYLDDYGYVFWQELPVEFSEIRQIEVVKGPASALFGFNAASGVINIVTYDPLTDPVNIAHIVFGTDGLLAGSVVSTAQVPGKGGLRIGLGGLRTNEYSTDAIPHSDGPYDTRPFEGNFNLDGRAKPTSNTEVTTDITESEASSLSMLPSYAAGKSQYRADSFKLGLAADTAFGLATLQGYINTSKFAYYSDPSKHRQDTNQIAVIQANDLIRIASDHAIRVALEYRDNRSWGTFSGGAFGYQDYAGSLMWSWQITPELSLTNSGRIDRLELEREDPLPPGSPYTLAQYHGAGTTAPSFNSGLVWQPTGFDTFRLLAGRAVQAPSLFDYAASIVRGYGPFTIVKAGSPFLKPAVTTNVELGYDRQLPALQAELDSAIYYSRTHDLLANAANTPPSFLLGNLIVATSENFGSGDVLGANFVLKSTPPDGLRWNIAYSLIAVRSHVPVGPPVTPFNFNNATPVSSIDFGLGYSWGKYEADLQGKWQSNYTDYFFNAVGAYAPVTIPNYLTMNARLGYQLTRAVTLAVTVTQLNADQIMETTGSEPERRILFSATYGF